MAIQAIQVNGRQVLTDSEGYLVDPAEWSEAFAKVLAAHEGLNLNTEH